MNRLLLLISLFTLLLVGQSCDSRNDYFAESNETPTLKIYVNNVEVPADFSDSIKLGYSYTVKCEIADDTDEPITPFLDNASLNDFAFTLDNVAKTFRLDGKRVGSANAVFCAKDAYGALAKHEILFTIFSNLPPVAKFTVSVIGEREIEVDASQSFDKDKRLGGAILLYEYDLNGYVFTSYSATAKYKFPTAGSKTISVKVKDNDNVFSNPVSKSIVL